MSVVNVFKKMWPALIIAVPLFVSGCSGQEDNLKRYIDEVKARPATPIPPIPAVRTYTPYKYEGLSGRDPFRQSIREGAEQVVEGGPSKGPRPDLQRPREYLERYELDTLEMVGTFSKEASDWALVKDPDGVVHRVSVGNYLGKNHGKVSTISVDEVELSEFITDGLGGWLVRDASLALEGS